MQGKLSQSHAEPFCIDLYGRVRTSLTAAVGFALSGLLAMSFCVGCDSHSTGLSTSSSTSVTSATSTTSANDSSSFAWPENPNPPTIRIELTGAAGEGSIEIALMPELAPKTVEQMLAWADEGYFDGTTFHRVIKDFMIQGGDPNSRDAIPTNDGQGGPGFQLDDEFSQAPFVRGVVGMGNTGRPHSAGSQFFIMQADRRDLDGAYTVIGRVRSGIEMVDAVVDVDIDTVGRWGPMSRPIENVVMAKVRRVGARTNLQAAGSSPTDAKTPPPDAPIVAKRDPSPAPATSPASRSPWDES